jgi:hypothetical protein
MQNIEDLEITPIQMQALCLLAAGNTKAEVSKIKNISASTLERWCKLPDFNKLLKKSVIDCYNAALAELCEGAKDAVKELRNIITSEKTPVRVKVQAINVLLTNAARAKDLILEERLESLENDLNE